MIRRPDENENDTTTTTTTSSSSSLLLAKNQHSLQPPFDTATVHGNILAIKVADVDDEVANNTTNEDFFLDYTKEEYLAFAARTDVVPPTVSEEDMEEAEEDEEDPEEEEVEDEDEEMQSEEEDEEEDENDHAAGFLELLMGQVLKRFQEENGREPEEHELQALQAAIVQKMGGAME